jgi:ArsR family transcriptional regulator
MNDKRTITAAPTRPARQGTEDLTSAYDARLAMLARALGHPARVAIVRMLTQTGECVCGDIVSRLPLAQATVSQHLKVLKEAGLIRGTIDAPRVCYCIDSEVVKEVQSLIASLTADVPDVGRIG